MQVAPSQTLFQAISHLGSGSRSMPAPVRHNEAASQTARHDSPAARPANVLQPADHAREASPDTPIRRGMFVDIRV